MAIKDGEARVAELKQRIKILEAEGGEVEGEDSVSACVIAPGGWVALRVCHSRPACLEEPSSCTFIIHCLAVALVSVSNPKLPNWR